MSGCVDVSVAMQVGLSNDASRNWIDPQSHEQPNETPTLITYRLIGMAISDKKHCSDFYEMRLIKRMTFVWDRHDQCSMLRD